MASEIIDQANELIELNLSNTIQRIRIDCNAVSAKQCQDCGEGIPEARRTAVPGCQRCAECQGLFELRHKQRIV